jgi:iron complex transport system ATP-binding protein
MTSRPLLEADDVGVAAGDRTLCEALDLAVGAGECWAIVGPNGAGKTTLLRALAGLDAPLRGEVRYGGVPVRTLSARSRALHRAFLPQDSQDAFPATALEAVLIGRHPHLARFAWESDSDVARAREALATFGLQDFAQRDVRTLSGGERRRVALAGLLVQDAPLLLLDEPSSHLDIAQQAAALEVFVELARRQRASVMMVLHDLHLATRFCDHAIAIGGGKASAGTAADILAAETLSALFGRALLELRGDRWRAFVPG